MPPDRPQPGDTPSDLADGLRAWSRTIPEALRPPPPGSPTRRILDAARSRFAREGFRGTTTRSISEQAGVNLAMIHYYFGDKTRLYRRVLAGELIAFFLEMAEGLSDAGGPTLASLPDRVVHAMRAAPDRLALLRRELGAGGPHLTAVIAELGSVGPLGFREILLSRVREARRRGEIGDEEPEQVLLFLVVHAHGLLLAEPALRMIFGREAGDPDFFGDALDAQRSLLERALGVDPSEDARP